MDENINLLDELEYIKKVSDDLQFGQYLISYIDLLGATSAIMKDENNFLFSVYQLFGTAKEMCETFGERLHLSSIKLKAFSDNIIFVYEIPLEYSPDEKSVAAQSLAFFTSMFQFLAFNKRILMRGGMTFGSLCFNDTLVWGKALIDAYQAENMYAIYPRILVSTQIVEMLGSPDAQHQYNTPVFKDADGQFYLNFMSTFSVDSRAYLIHHMRSVVCELEKEYIKDNKILQKLSWLKSYILRFQNENQITEQMIIEALDADKKIHEDIMAGKYAET